MSVFTKHGKQEFSMPVKLNILQITTHDSGRHFGCYGHPTVQTPSIDQLADEGVLFSNSFCTVPICSASRASQLTGLYPQTHGLLDLVGFGWHLHDNVKHASQVLKSAGYRTMLYGVQHEVPGDKLDRLAFDSAQPGPSHAAGVADSVIDFLKKEGTPPQPFYAQIGFFETHTPFDRMGTEPDMEQGVEVPPYLADDEASRQAMAAFQGSVRQVDTAVGRILDALRESGLEDNTLVVFTTDHGIEMPRAKWHLYDPGIAIALVMRCPSAGLTGGQTCDHLMSNIDYLPTILDLAQIECPKEVQGHSFAAALRGQNPSRVRDAVFGLYHKTQTRYVRTNRYKLIRHFDTATDFYTVPVPIGDTLNKRGVGGQVELFDLETDPNEFTNCAGRPEHANTQQELESMLWTWMESVDDPLLHGPVRTPLYESAIRQYHSWKKVRNLR
jgi:arylsulfatase A-like enzyme